MANMFRDASRKTITPNMKDEEPAAAMQAGREVTGEEQIPAAMAAKSEKTTPKREKPQLRNGDSTDSGSMGAILSGKLAVKPTGGQRSVYLDDEVFAAVEELAEKNGATKSKIINMILRSALFGE